MRRTRYRWRISGEQVETRRGRFVHIQVWEKVQLRELIHTQSPGHNACEYGW